MMTREIEGWYPPNVPRDQQQYCIIVFEPVHGEILIDAFEVDGQDVDTKGPAFEYMVDQAVQSILEGDPDE